jgi:protein involved in polysaccharide export with SLBB domain
MIRAKMNSYRSRFIAYVAVIAGVTMTAPALGQYFGVTSGQTSVLKADQHPFLSGDAIKIKVPLDSNNFINGIYHVDDYGFVNLPVIGKIKIDNMTLVSLTAFLDTAYLKFLRFPTVHVEPLMRLSLLGGFYRPGLYYFTPETSLWEAVATAGGPMREDGLKLLNWERGGTVLKTDLLPNVEAGTSLANIGFKSGDQIWVTHLPKRSKWEAFRTDVLPMLTITISTAATIATLYFSYEAYRSQR